MNPDQNQPQDEQPNVNPTASTESNDATTGASNENPFNSSVPAAEPATQPAAPAPAQPVVAQQPQVSGGSKGLAITSLVLGIIGFLTAFMGLGILLGLVAIILGIIALVKHHGGKGMAIAGLILGVVTFVFGGFFFLLALNSYSGIQQKALDNLCSTDPSNAKCSNR